MSCHRYGSRAKHRMDGYLIGLLLVTSCARNKPQPVFAMSNSHDLPLNTQADRHYSFGDIAEGDVIRHSFGYTNTTNDPIDIVSIQTSCGCIAATPTASHLRVGETSEIEMRFDTLARLGKLSGFIAVQTTAQGELASSRYTFDCNVRNYVTARPSQLTIGPCGRGQESTQRVEFSSTDGGYFLVNDVKTGSDDVVCAATSDSRSNTGFVELRVVPRSKSGVYRGEIRVSVNHEHQVTCRIPFVLSVEPAYEVVPRGSMSFGRLKKGTHPERVLTVRSRTHVPGFRVEHVRIEGAGKVDAGSPFLGTTVDANSEEFRITVRIVGDLPDKYFLNHLHVITNDPVDDEVDIPVFGFVE